MNTASSLRAWRTLVLNGVLGVVFILWMFALTGGINNAITEYRENAEYYETPLSILGSALAVYVGTTALIAFITFHRKLKLELRAGILLFSLYMLGTIGMFLSSFSGDGRVFFFAFIILAFIFFDLRYSLAAFSITLLTLAVIGYLQVSGAVAVSSDLQINAANPGAWISGGIVFLMLSVAVLATIAYLLKAFEKSLAETQNTLQREQRLSQILRTVRMVNQLIIRSQDPAKLLDETCKHLVIGRGYSFAWVGLLEPDRVHLKLSAFAGDAVDQEKFNTRINPEEGLACASQAIRTRSFFRVEPAGDDDPCKACPRRVRYPNRSAISLPLLRDDQPLGVLVVDHNEPSAVFDDQEIMLLQDLADDLAYALEHLESSKKLDIYTRYQSLLNEVTQTALSAFDLDSLLREFIGKLEKALDADGYYFALWDETRQTPSGFIFSDNLKEVFSNTPNLQPDDRTFSRSILDEGRVLAITDVMNTPFINPGFARQFGVSSALGMPLVADNMRLGVLAFGYKESHLFTPEEVELAEQASRQFALAILKVKLNDEMRIKAAELEQLYSAAQDMASSLLDPPALLAKLARHMTEALQVTSASIVSTNMVDATMQVVGEYWGDKALPEEIHPDLGKLFPNAEYPTIMNAMLAGEVIVMHFDDDEMTPAERAQFSDFGIKSMMFVPILAHGQLFGDIELWESRCRREFTEADVRLAQAMAGHAASIIENSTLFAQTRQREAELDSLLTVARAVSSSLQLPDVLKQAATTLARLMRVDFCSLSDYLPQQNVIATSALYSADGDVSGASDLGHYFSLDEYPATLHVLLSGQPIVNRLDDPDTDPAEARQLLHDEMYTSLMIPLRLRGQSLGLAELFSSDPNRQFNPEEVKFACALADQVAVAIENAQLYEKLEQRESYFRALIENSAEGVAILDARGIVRYIAPSEERLTGYTVEEVLGNSGFRFIHPDDLPRVLVTFEEGRAVSGAVRTTQYRLRRKDGEWRYFEITGHNMLDDPQIAGVVVNYRDITERKLAEKAVEESEERYRTIFQSAGVPIWEDDYSALMTAIDEIRKTGITDFRSYLDANPDFVKNAARLIKVLDVNTAAVDLMEARDKSELLGPLGQLFRGGVPSALFVDEVLALANGLTHYEHESFLYTLQGRRRDVWISITLPQWVTGYERVLVSTLDITERKQAERALQENRSRLEGIVNTALNAIITVDESQQIVLFNPFAERVFGCTAEFALGKPLDIFIPERFRKSHQTHVERFGITNESNRTHGQMESLYGLRVNGEEFPMEAFVSQHQAGNKKFFTVIMRDITERKNAEEHLRRHTMELETLALASSALRTAQNVSEMIPILASHALRAVNGSYAYIFLLDPETNVFVSRGWYSANAQTDPQAAFEAELILNYGKGITGRVAETGEIYMTEDVQKDPVVLVLEGERERIKDVHGSISLPLRNEDKTIGVMHILSTEPRVFKDTEIRLLTALAETASNAIHRAILFEKTLEHAVELAQAYDNTLAGWARALELRDEPTEGHTRRVTELTLQLARVMGLSGESLTNIQRGAILHDIGKMGIPDSILHKPGPFNGYEQTIMRGHPQLAYDMLSTISFLQTALDIPYCHHEWWDGTGYPRGLMGEEIPLAARIFSVVDVWDALTSDRPYRPAWSRQKALDYIRDGARTQFDPRIVETFLNLIEGR